DIAQNNDNIFQADQCDAFDSDVDEAPTAQTMFMANFSSADQFMMKLVHRMILTHSLRMAGLWFRMFRGDGTGFKETMLGVMLLQEMRELKTQLVMLMLGKESQSSVTTAMRLVI
nr:integrase, catalytic region, zinc finger, CCHC-type, peptidase aspartic, catalytic [Tanacetum cinerariifolium]